MPPFRHRAGLGTAESGPYAAGSSGPRNEFPASSAAVTSHSGPRPTACSAAAQSEEELVGPVTEGLKEHLRRHTPFNGSCLRCQWIEEGDEWFEKYGRVPEGFRTPCTGENWIRPRHPRRGGQWGLGYTVCALVHTSEAPLLGNYSKWARYEVRTIQRVNYLRRHAESDQHKRALQILKSASKREPRDPERLRG